MMFNKLFSRIGLDGFNVPKILSIIFAFLLVTATCNAAVADTAEFEKMGGAGSSLVNQLDQSLMQLVTNLNSHDFSESALANNVELFGQTQGLYLIYLQRLRDQVEVLTIAGLKSKTVILENYLADYERDVGRVISALEFYYGQNPDNEGNVLLQAYEQVKTSLAYYWSQYQVAGYADSLNSRFKPILHAQGLPSEAIESYSVDLLMPDNLQEYSVGALTQESLLVASHSLAMLEKVQALESDPIKIYQFVEKLPSELYWGLKKGADATVDSGGNSYDKAQLLVKLYQAAGYKAHMVDGLVELPIDLLKQQFGISEKTALVKYLSNAGQVFKPISKNSKFWGIQFKHTWVEAEVPYVNYRGTGIEDEKRDWIPLDVYFNQPVFNLPADIPSLDLAEVKAYQQQIILNGTDTSPLAPYVIDSEPEVSSMGTSLPYLPVSLPYTVLGYFNKSTVVSADLKQMVNISVLKEGFIDSEYFSVDVASAQLYGKKISLSFTPATLVDQNLAITLGGMDKVPAFLLSVLPVLEIDGKRFAMGNQALPMAQSISLKFSYEVPFKKVIQKDILSGGYYSLAFADTHVPSDTLTGHGSGTGLGAEMLSESAYLYLKHWIDAEKNLGESYGVAYAYPVPSLAIMANANRVNYFEEKPVSLEWAGVELDAIYHPVNQQILLSQEQASDSSSDVLIALNRLIGLEASWYEAKIISEYFSVNAISADTLISRAHENGIDILTEINGNLIDGLAVSDDVKQIIHSSIAKGYEVLIPASEQTIDDWNGFAWAISNPATGYSGYFLSGAIAGGTSTNASDVIWQLKDPTASKPSSGVDAFAYLEIVAGDGGVSTVNEEVELTVLARGYLGEAVANVPITFTTGLGQGRLNGKDTVTVITSEAGLATVSLLHGPKILEGVYVDEGGTYLQKYGVLNVALDVGGAIEGMITRYYKPGEAILFVEESSWRKYKVYSQDEFMNPVANVEFTVTAYTNPLIKPGTADIVTLVAQPLSIWIDQPNEVEEMIDTGLSAMGTNRGNTGPVPITVKTQIADFCSSYQVNFIGSNGVVEQVDREVDCNNIVTIYAPCHVDNYQVMWNEQLVTIKGFEGADLGSECKYTMTGPFTKFWNGELGYFFSGDLGSRYLQPETGLVGDRYWYGAVLCERDKPFYITAHTANEFGQALIPINKKSLILKIENRELCKQYFFQPIDSDTSFTDYGFTNQLMQLRSGLYAVPYIESGDAYIDGDYVYYTGSELGVNTFNLATEKLPEIAYKGNDHTFEVVVVKGELSSISNPKGNYNGDGSVVLSEALTVSYKLFPESVTLLGSSARLKIYKDGLFHGSYLAKDYSAQGEIKIPRGNIFNSLSHYEVEVEFGNKDIVSERKAIQFPLISAHSKKITVNAYVDTSNNQMCASGTGAYISLTDGAIVSVSAYRYFEQGNETNTNSLIKMRGEEIELLKELPFGKGLKQPLGFSTAGLFPGAYGLKITAINGATGKSETVNSTLNYKLEHEDQLPLAHTLYNGIDLANASLNISRSDLNIAGNTDLSAISLNRTYNSKNSHQGYLGAGWSDNNLITLHERPCGYVIANGIKFIDSGDGYEAANGYHGSLVQLGDSYKLTTVAGTEYFFKKHKDALHKVNSIKFADGYTLKYAYKITTDDIIVKRIEDNFKRFMEYNYSDFEKVSNSVEVMTRLTSVNYNDALEITYDYDTYARLNSVFLKASDSSIQLIESYEYSQATAVDEATHETYAEQNEYPAIEYPSFYEDSVFNASQQSQRLPLLLSVSDALGQTTRYTYRPQILNKLEIINPDFVGYGYPTVTEIEDKNGNITKFSYEFAGSDNGSATITRPNGTILYTLDSYGSAVAIKDYAGTQTNEFDNQHQLIKYTDSNGNIFSYTYDQHGNKTQESSGNWITTFNYGTIETQAGKAINALIKQTTANKVVEYDYDGTCPAPAKQSYPVLKRGYNDNCQLAIEIDGAGNETSFLYDKLSRLKKMSKKDGASGKTFHKEFEWNNLNHNTLQSDFNGHVSRFEHDLLGRITKVTDPKGKTLVKERDALGQIKIESDQLGRATQFTYDAMGNQTSAEYQGHKKTFSYDKNNNLKTQSDWLGRSVSYTYNEADQLTSEAHPLDKSINYTRDGNGNITQESTMVQGEEQKTIREYDFKNRLIKSTDAQEYVQSWTYDDADNLIAVINKNGINTNYDYDTHGNLIAMVQGGDDVDKRAWQYSYDDRGLKTQEINPIGIETTIKYDAFANAIETRKQGYGQTNSIFDGAGNKLEETNPLGETTSFSYSKTNGLTQIKDPLGNTTDFTLDALNRVASKRLPNSESISYAYDGFDREITQTDSLGKVLQNTFDAMGNLMSSTDANGHETSYTIDALNRTTLQTFSDGNSESFAYNVLNQPISQTDAKGNTRIYQYDKVGNLIYEKNALHQVATFSYDGEANQTSKTDRNGHTTQYEYNAFNQLSKTTNALEEAITRSYDALGRIQQETDAKDFVTQYSYSEESTGREVKTQRNGITLLTERYNVGGQLVYRQDANGNRVAFQYDELGRKVLEVHPESSVKAFSYDTVSNLLSKSDGENRTTEYEYDARNRTTKETMDGVAREYEYDNNGNLTQTTNGLNNRWVYEYDNRNRLQSITTPDNITSTHEYDENGNKTQTTNGKNQPTQWEYDELNRISTLTYPTGDQHTYSYDPMGSLRYEVLPNAQQINFEYDDLNRLQIRSDENGTLSYSYDKNGNLTTKAINNSDGQASGTESYGFDNFDRLISKKDTYGNTSQFAYDKNGNQTALNYGWNQNGTVKGVSYSFDAKNRLKTVSNNLGSTSFGYYRNDLIKTKTFSNGISSNYAYDDKNQLTSISHQANSVLMQQQSYIYDDNRNTTQKKEFNGTVTLITDYLYDSQDRLTQATYSGDSDVQNNGTATYGYDDNGNRESETFTDEGGTQSKNIGYSYNNNDQLTGFTDSIENSQSSISYDQLGNLTKKALTKDQTSTTTDYVYDVRNQLRQVQTGGSTVGAFLYDASGLRIYKSETLKVNGQNTTNNKRYHYNQLNVVAEFDDTNKALYSYYHDQSQIIGRVDHDAESNNTTQKLQTYHQDALGSTSVVANTDASLTARYQYDAWGQVQAESGNSDSNGFTYTGHERDLSTGLIYAKARYYDPQLGVFLSRDPFEGYDDNPLSLHRYLYAYQNPLKYTDPTGRIAALADGANALGDFDEWLRDQNQSFGDGALGQVAGAANGVSRGVVALGEGFLRTVNYGANWTSVATGGFGQDEWAMSHAQELQQSHETITNTYDYFANQDGLSKTGQQLKQFGSDLSNGKATAASDLLAFSTGFAGGVGAGKVVAEKAAKLAGKTAQVVREGTAIIGTAVAVNVKTLAAKVRGGRGVAADTIMGPNDGPQLPQVQQNKRAGDAVRDQIALREGGVTEVGFKVSGGWRYLDVVKYGRKKVGFESKVGRTSLGKSRKGKKASRVRQELARDLKILRAGELDKVIWEFSPSKVTGKSGPTKPLFEKLEKYRGLGIEIREN